jgi:hypothetical protein
MALLRLYLKAFRKKPLKTLRRSWKKQALKSS